jgi:hypothetical protein
LTGQNKIKNKASNIYCTDKCNDFSIKNLVLEGKNDTDFFLVNEKKKLIGLAGF